MQVLSDRYTVPPTETISYPMDPAFTIKSTAGPLNPGESTAAPQPFVWPPPPELKLPLEIVEGIINVVDDKRDLKACALSCSYFRRSCQSRLFRDFKIDCDRDIVMFNEGGLVHTIVHSDHHTSITTLIRWLRIVNRYGVWGMQGGGIPVDCMLGRFMKKLNAVEKLELRGGGLEWGHGELVDGLIATLRLPALRELKLASLERFPMPLILSGWALKKLEFERVLFMPSGMSVGSRKPLMSPSLEELRMDNRGMGLSLLRLHFLSSSLGHSAFTKLKKLRLEYRDSEGDEPDDINRLLTACQSSLEDLVLFLAHDAYASPQLFARSVGLHRLINLRHFSTRMIMTTRGGYLEEDNPFNLLNALFCGCPPSLESIRLSFFHRFGDVGDENVPEASGWNELDKRLTLMSRLQEVSVMVCCNQCAPGQIVAHQNVYDLPKARAKGISIRIKFTNNINSALEE